MNEPQLPSPEDILLTHAPLLRILVAALIEGTRHVQSYVLWQDEALDRTLAPALVRKGAKRFLLRGGESVSDEEVEYETDSLPNIGLAIGSQGIRIRILKSDGGSLPVPGPSSKRQLFYAQQGSLFPVAENGDAQSIAAVNLVLHWRVDDEYSLSRVYLACPKAGALNRASVESYWDEPIWRAKATSEEAVAEDLDIRLDEDEGTGTGNAE